MWTPLARPDLGVALSISDAVGRGVNACPSTIENLRRTRRLMVLSDVAGDHPAASHRAYSFLVITPDAVQRWLDVWKPIRAARLRDLRRISYVRLGDRRRRGVLDPFLAASSRLDGFLVTALIDKRLQLFEGEAVPEEFRHWKRASLDRLLTTTHLLSILLAGLTKAGQDVLWVSDEDAIAPNEARMWDVCEAVARVGSQYLAHDLGHFRFATAKSDDGSRELEDLLAVPDLAAGALAELTSSYVRAGATLTPDLVLPPPAATAPKCRRLVPWIAGRIPGPTQIAIRVDPNSPTSVFRVSRFVFSIA